MTTREESWAASWPKAAVAPRSRERRRNDAAVVRFMVCLLMQEQEQVAVRQHVADECSYYEHSLQRACWRTRIHSHASLSAMKVYRRGTHMPRRGEFRQTDVRTPH